MCAWLRACVCVRESLPGASQLWTRTLARNMQLKQGSGGGGGSSVGVVLLKFMRKFINL